MSSGGVSDTLRAPRSTGVQRLCVGFSGFAPCDGPENWVVLPILGSYEFVGILDGVWEEVIWFILVNLLGRA